MDKIDYPTSFPLEQTNTLINSTELSVLSGILNEAPAKKLFQIIHGYPTLLKHPRAKVKIVTIKLRRKQNLSTFQINTELTILEN